jgi:hypothetical protein
MTGEGLPTLLNWEVKEAPYAGYGVLRFSGGRVARKSGLEDTELAAIIDIDAGKVVAIEPQRQGSRVSTWTWDGDRLRIASIDGVTDEYQLRRVAVAVVGPGSQLPRRDGPQGEAWAPWDQPFGAPRPDVRHRKYSKPKSLFQFLFGN